MPTHVRQQIRETVKAAVLNLPTTGDRVFTGRVRPLGKAFQPTLLVYTTTETSARTAGGRPPILSRPVIVSIEGRISVGANVVADDLLDDIALEVERAMAVDPSLGGLAENLQFMQTDIDIESADTERLTGGIRLQYRVTYRTYEGEPDTAV